MQVQNVDDDLANSFGLESQNGALVADVLHDSPAERAGIEVGDVIIGYDNQAIANAKELSKLVGASDSGDKVTLGVIRGAKEIDLNVVLGDAETQIASVGSEQQLGDLGMTLAPLTEDMQRRMGVEPEVSGVVVVKIDPNGSAAKQGIRRGDILMQADREAITSPADLEKTLSKAKKSGRSSVPVLVRRGDVQQFASLPVT